MPIYTELEEPEFAALKKRDCWVAGVLLYEYGELEGREYEEETSADLDFLAEVPESRRYDFEDVECSLAFVSAKTGYSCTLWDVTGAEDEPWATILADVYGMRVLQEYSIFDESADDGRVEAVLGRAAIEIPERLEKGDFDRIGEPAVIPEYLYVED